MKEIFLKIKKVLPEPVKKIFRWVIFKYKNRSFTPYLKKKNVEGVKFDFWISDLDGRDWYDIQAADPVWLEMRFVRDHIIKTGDVILECGGHHGCTAIVLSNWVGAEGKVITFEALPQNCNIIQKNIEQNNLQNVTLVRKAVGMKTGKIKINETSNSSVALAGKGIEVEMTSLDEYEHLNPTFLKIDVEGFEVQVLQGAKSILAKNPKLAIELHTEQLSQFGTTVEALFELIDVKNYKFWIQWEDSKQPEEYNIGTPIVKRVHLFGIPINK